MGLNEEASHGHDHLCRFFVHSGTVGLRPGLQPKLLFLMLLCRSDLHPSGSRQRQSSFSDGKINTFRTCLKEIVTATCFGWSCRGFKKLGKSNKQYRQHHGEHSKAHFKCVSLVSEMTACGIFLLSKSFSSFSSLTTVKTLWTLTSVLCWPPTLQSVQLWHLYLPFSRKLDSQLNKNVLCLFVFIYYQSALTRSPLGMRGEMFTLELLAKGFMGDIIQLQILIYGRELDCDE